MTDNDFLKMLYYKLDALSGKVKGLELLSLVYDDETIDRMHCSLRPAEREFILKFVSAPKIKYHDIDRSLQILEKAADNQPTLEVFEKLANFQA